MNMSLGGPNNLTAAMDFYTEVRKKGKTLIIAASGNNGSDEYLFPASYSSVVSVGAVNETMEKAGFSQYNR